MITTKNEIKYIVGAGFFTILVLTSLLFYIAINQSQKLNDRMSNLILETNTKIQAANSMRDSIRLRANSLKAMALEDDYFARDDEYLRFLNYSRIYRDGRDKLLAGVLTGTEQKILENLDKATRISQPLNDYAAELLQSDSSAEEIDKALAEAGSHQQNILKLLSELIVYEKIKNEQALASANEDYGNFRLIMFAITVATLVLSVIIAAFVIRSTTLKNNHIYYQANHDSLTGLYNRRAFEEKFRSLMKMSRESGLESVLLYLDLDQFKIVNDSCGHAAGDELLSRIARVLSSKLRSKDFIARLGGDEFGVLLINCDMSGASHVADSLRKAVENFRLDWEGREFSIGVSIGAVPISFENGDMATILSTADMACLDAKRSGRNRVRIVESDDQQIARHRDELECLARIKRAVADDRLVLYYQPVVPVKRNARQWEHAEILVRMISEEGELIPPGNFIPVAEVYGQMLEIDKWVIRQVSKWLAEWPHAQIPPTLMINVSGTSICDESFLNYVVENLDSEGSPRGNICFEITETAAIENFDKAEMFINVLRAKGFEFALDDFGSGLSSFGYLKKLPVDYLKIDGLFVKEMINDPIDHAMVKSISEIGHVMGKKIIAEFVENGELLAMLRDIKVDYAQGFGIAVPRPLAELVAPLEIVSSRSIVVKGA